MGKGLAPGPALEKALGKIKIAMRHTQFTYWLGFGGLWGLARNDGFIPDNDLDLCVFYGSGHEKLLEAFKRHDYLPGHVMLSDIENKALHIGLNCQGLPHLCVSFWYEHDGIMYYCHDQKREIKGTGSPTEYWFKGVPAALLKPEYFRDVEWPGVDQRTTVRVPRFPGTILDHCYPDWAYKKQRYEVQGYRQRPEKMRSYYKGGAVSPYMVHLESMAQWGDPRRIAKELADGKKRWELRLKTDVKTYG